MLYPLSRMEGDALIEACAPFDLSPAQTAALQRREEQALSRTGRVRFGASILPRLAAAFADSPHIQSRDFAETLGELTELFYALKSETEDALADEELIQRMTRAFNGPAQGALTLLPDFLLCEQDMQGSEEEDDED